MPFNSVVQRRTIYAKAERGENSPFKVKARGSEAKGTLPKRVEAKKRAVEYMKTQVLE